MIQKKFNQLFQYLFQFRKLISIILFGIALRLIIGMFINHEYDFFNILILSKSVADTGSISEGFFSIKRIMSLDTQLFGKIYYQIAAGWLHVLNFLRVVDIRYIFDNKEYSDAQSYLVGFGEWAPLLYQLASIKLIQFLFDFILLGYSLKISSFFFGKKSIPLMTLFWATNIFMIYTSFGMFQSDLAMVSFLVAGVYHAIAASQNNSSSKRNIIIMLVFFAAGAVIKQLPILFVVPFLIVLSTKLRSFILYCVLFGAIYLLLSQGFLADGVLTKQFFLSSVESMALFNFRLNDVPLFMAGYTIFVAGVFFFRKQLQKEAFHLVILSAIIISLVYIFEDMRYFFVQFSVWIMPFLAFLTLKDYRFGYFFIIPIIGFFRRSFIDRGVLSGSFGASLGSILSNVPSYNTVLKSQINPDLVYFLLNSIQVIAGILLLIILVDQLKKKESIILGKFPEYKFGLRFVSFFLLAFFMIVYSADFYFATHHALITKNKFDLREEVIVDASHSIDFKILNPEKKKVTGLQIYMKRFELFENGMTFVTLSDSDGGIILKQSISDMSFPKENEQYYINFTKTISNPEINVVISKDFTSNRIAINSAKVTGWGHEHASNSTFDYYYKYKPVQLEFKDTEYAVNVQGVYGWTDILRHSVETFKTKPTFYTGYSIAIIALVVIAIFLWKKEKFAFKL